MAKKAKKAAKTKKKKNPAGGASAMPKVRVRMYRQGLGDCFLVTFDLGGDEKHMLIDCGTLGATTTGVKLAKVVENINTTTGGHLHLLIATHEHLDHVSGFRSQKEIFKGMQIDHVWMAWTENPTDPIAKDIVKYKNDLGAALKGIAQSLAKSSRASLGSAMADILGFFDDNILGASDFAPTVDEAMDFLRTGTSGKTDYRNPGDGPFEESWLPGFRIFILGPPRDQAKINNLGEHGSSQLYSLAASLQPAAEVFAGRRPAVPAYTGGNEDFEASLPFDIRYRREESASETRRMFAAYLEKDDEWRTVDDDWLNVASDLALQLDSATNNTSLALAIERIADGKVLLFPADAQEGNWLSWHDEKMKWKVTSGPGAGTVRATDLLARTVFYKVGHHSSHNATAKGKGLELMKKKDELTAFIPVDRKVALGRNPKDSWQMPARTLYRRLLEQCEGRVVRSDIGFAADPATAADKATEKEFKDMATAADWKKWAAAQKKAEKAAHIAVTPMFVDYVLE
jgi:hypothetical protein